MATRIPGSRPSKTSSSKKSVSKQPTPINSVQNTTSTASDGLPVTAAHLGIEEEIRQRAYEFYEQRGRQHGFEQEDWARAEAEVLNKYKREKSA